MKLEGELPSGASPETYRKILSPSKMDFHDQLREPPNSSPRLGTSSTIKDPVKLIHKLNLEKLERKRYLDTLEKKKLDDI